MVIVDSIGVVVGFAASNPRTAGAIRAVRRWFTRLLRPEEEASASPADIQKQIEATEQELQELRDALDAAEKTTNKALEVEAQHQIAVARQRKQKEHAHRRPKPS